MQKCFRYIMNITLDRDDQTWNKFKLDTYITLLRNQLIRIKIHQRGSEINYFRRGQDKRIGKQLISADRRQIKDITM